MRRIEHIQNDLRLSLKKKLIHGKFLLNNCKFLDENSRLTPSYNDPSYAPFYYYLGKLLNPKSVFSWNFSLGFLEKCFFMSCKDTESFFAFRKKEDVFFSPRMAVYNVKKSFKNDFNFYHGKIHDDELHKNITKRKWDCFFITEENRYDDLLYFLELSWDNLNNNGIIVVEYVSDLKKMKSAFHAFAENNELKPFVFNTRYGTGILQK